MGRHWDSRPPIFRLERIAPPWKAAVAELSPMAFPRFPSWLSVSYPCSFCCKKRGGLSYVCLVSFFPILFWVLRESEDGPLRFQRSVSYCVICYAWSPEGSKIVEYKMELWLLMMWKRTLYVYCRLSVETWPKFCTFSSAPTWFLPLSWDIYAI